MKKTYIIPTVVCRFVLNDSIMLSTSIDSINYGGTGDGNDEAVKGNTEEEQTPWYRR